MKLLAGKTAGVTGAGSGIGRAIALMLADAGAKVAVTDMHEAAAKQVRDEILASGGEAVALHLDVTNQNEAHDVVVNIVEQWGRLDIWCNNAGVSTMNRFVDLTSWDWDFNMNVNAKGTFLCSQVVVKQMLSQSPDEDGIRGRIINTASMAGKRGNAPFLAHYVASKFAVLGLTQAMAGEFASEKILVNAVCPGYVRTSMQERELQWEAELRGVSIEEVQRLYIEDTPLGRLETPEDVAKVVLFLASPLANFITGEAINVNGGAWMD